MNSLRDAGACFGTDTNKVSIFSAAGVRHDFGMKPKNEVARDIFDTILGK